MPRLLKNIFVICDFSFSALLASALMKLIKYLIAKLQILNQISFSGYCKLHWLEWSNLMIYIYFMYFTQLYFLFHGYDYSLITIIMFQSPK